MGRGLPIGVLHGAGFGVQSARDIWHEDSMWPAFAIAVGKSVIMLSYVALERDFPFGGSWFRAAVLLAALAIVGSILVARWAGRRTLDRAANAQLILLAGLIVFVLAEVLFRLAPTAFPENVRRLV